MKMGLKNLAEQKNWVVVHKDGGVTKFERFSDAVKQKDGNLMTESYYLFHYLPSINGENV
jgi:hypothetical protein